VSGYFEFQIVSDRIGRLSNHLLLRHFRFQIISNQIDQLSDHLKHTATLLPFVLNDNEEVETIFDVERKPTQPLPAGILNLFRVR
jgi:hypothetical protein